MFERPKSGERAALVQVDINCIPDAAVEEEFHQLALSAGAQIILAERFSRGEVEPRYYIGRGQAEALAAAVKAHDIELIIVNAPLSPSQERNLEKLCSTRVLDRSGLVLDIFAQRARSHEGKLQVELAQLNHLATRLVRGWTHLERQKGGIGLRGPGETQLETDRRLIAQKITALKKRLEAARRQRATRRKAREHGSLPTFALVGYTNTGKSSLFNRLTKADVLAKNQLFATLDTTARRLYLNPSASIILTDTVGFVRDLPHGLVAAFSATLEETALADVLLHVVDAAHPEHERQIDDVNEVLREIGAGDVPQIVLYNKTDLLPPEERRFGVLRDVQGRAVAANISVKTGEGLDVLREILAEHAVSDGLKNQNIV